MTTVLFFITIDDNEYSNLKALMDEIFGEENFVANVVWQARKSVQNDTDISVNHNYVLIYAKNRRQEERDLKKVMQKNGMLYLALCLSHFYWINRSLAIQIMIQGGYGKLTHSMLPASEII